MTVGSRITHSERFARARAHGDHLHGIQARAALPDWNEEIDPAFSHHAGDGLPQWTEAGVGGAVDRGQRLRAHRELPDSFGRSDP
jgi:redox-sensitive bicupin YhaK (pirin superfamily)